MVEDDRDQPLILALQAEGYRDFRRLEGRGWCALHDYIHTCGIVVGLTEWSYEGRYCFASSNEARDAFLAWDGRGDPDGPWLKWKSAAGERLGPGWAQLVEPDNSAEQEPSPRASAPQG